jgi:hypothetical protein
VSATPKVNAFYSQGARLEGTGTAKTDQKGKKGQKASHLFLPLFALLVRFCPETVSPISHPAGMN